MGTNEEFSLELVRGLVLETYRQRCRETLFLWQKKILEVASKGEESCRFETSEDRKIRNKNAFAAEELRSLGFRVNLCEETGDGPHPGYEYYLVEWS